MVNTKYQRTLPPERIFIVESSLGWQVVARGRPTHIVGSEEGALAEALGLASAIRHAEIVTVRASGRASLRTKEMAA